MRAAERRLAATAAREGVAAAELYPRITISGVLGLLAGRGNLFGTSDSRAWAVTPALQWSAFDLGSARARLRGAQAVTAEALAEYEKTMLLALEETETALVTYRQQQERLVKLTDEVRESARAAGIARRALSRGRRRLPLAARRRAHRSCRPRTGRRRRRPMSSPRWSGSIAPSAVCNKRTREQDPGDAMRHGETRA